MTKSGEKWRKVARHMWSYVAKSDFMWQSGEKCQKVVISGGKWGKVGKVGKVAKSGEKW